MNHQIEHHRNVERTRGKGSRRCDSTKRGRSIRGRAARTTGLKRSTCPTCSNEAPRFGARTMRSAPARSGASGSRPEDGRRLRSRRAPPLHDPSWHCNHEGVAGLEQCLQRGCAGIPNATATSALRSASISKIPAERAPAKRANDPCMVSSKRPHPCNAKRGRLSAPPDSDNDAAFALADEFDNVPDFGGGKGRLRLPGQGPARGSASTGRGCEVSFLSCRRTSAENPRRSSPTVFSP